MTLPPGSPVPPGWASVTMGVPSAPAQEAFSVERETEARSRGPARSLEGVDSNTRPRQIPGYMCWGSKEPRGTQISAFMVVQDQAQARTRIHIDVPKWLHRCCTGTWSSPARMCPGPSAPRQHPEPAVSWLQPHSMATHFSQPSSTGGTRNRDPLNCSCCSLQCRVMTLVPIA